MRVLRELVGTPNVWVPINTPINQSSSLWDSWQGLQSRHVLGCGQECLSSVLQLSISFFFLRVKFLITSYKQLLLTWVLSSSIANLLMLETHCYTVCALSLPGTLVLPEIKTPPTHVWATLNASFGIFFLFLLKGISPLCRGAWRDFPKKKTIRYIYLLNHPETVRWLVIFPEPSWGHCVIILIDHHYKKKSINSAVEVET